MAATNKTSGLLTADAAVATGRAIVAGVIIITDKTNDAALILYDNTAASGTEVFKALVPGTNDTAFYQLPEGGVRCYNGIYADIAGTGAEYIVLYR